MRSGFSAGVLLAEYSIYTIHDDLPPVHRHRQSKEDEDNETENPFSQTVVNGPEPLYLPKPCVAWLDIDVHKRTSASEKQVKNSTIITKSQARAEYRVY